MAALQSLRKHNKLLVGAIGIALFGFILTDFLRSSNSTEPTDVGSIYGNTLSRQDYEVMVEEFTDFYRLVQSDNIDENTRAQIRAQVWNNFLFNQVIERECRAFGIDVCDQEITDAYANISTQNIMALARVLGGAQYRQVIAQCEELQRQNYQDEQITRILKAWQFVQHNVRSELLANKYNAIIAATSVGNDIEGRANFDAQNIQYDVAVASLPFTCIPDSTIQITDEELRSKYNELKPRFYRNYETRSVQYIAEEVRPSQADQAALRTELTQIATELETAEASNIARIVRESGSRIAYYGYNCTETGLPAGFASRVKEMEVGQVIEPFNTPSDTTMNVVRLVAKTNLPDSVEVSIIPALNAAQADSIIACHQGGESLDSLIAHQGGGTQWVVTTYQTLANVTSSDIARYLNLVMSTATGQTVTFEDNNGLLSGGQYRATYVINVKDRRHFSDRYDIAVVKREIDFSNETMSEARNRLSLFMANNLTADDIQANAMLNGYVLNSTMMSQGEYGISVWTGRQMEVIPGTGEVKHWLFNDAEVGQISDRFDCGRENNILVVAILKDIYPAGYLPINNPEVESILRNEIMKEKKAAILAERMNGKSHAEILQLEGALNDTVSHVTLAGSLSLPSMRGISEFALPAAIAGKSAGTVVSPVRGNLGVYSLNVLSQSDKAQEYNAETERTSAANSHAIPAQYIIGSILERAEIVDNRYIFEQ